MRPSKHNDTFNEIIKQFNGLKKVEAYDLMSRIELLLFYAPNPINFCDEQNILTTNRAKTIDIDPFQFTILPNGNFAKLMGNNDFIKIYKEHKSILPNWSIFNSYYFTSKYYPLEFLKLTKKNILSSIEAPEERKKLKYFLKENKVDKIDSTNKRLLILDL